jgi:dihydroorotate dehydrogenase (NAD+) catalytic subunit
MGLEIKCCGFTFKNPLIAASGTFGYGEEYAEIFDPSLLGGIVTKGLTLNPRKGNKGTRIWETPSGLLNSIGLENPGIEAFICDKLPYLLSLGTAERARPVIIANLAGSSVEDYGGGAELLERSAVDMVELNISCPNVKKGGMGFGLSPETAAEVTQRVRKALRSKPLIVKLSPNAPDLNAVAEACIGAGADALSLVNTFLGMAIEVYKRRPVFDNISAGLSGPAIRPLALRLVWDLYKRLNEGAGRRVPLIGLGGIATTEDALEFMLAGASLLEVGSATFSRPDTMIEIIKGLTEYSTHYHLKSINEIIGEAHVK